MVSFVTAVACEQELLDNQSKIGGAPNISYSRSLPMELQGEGAPPVAVTKAFAGFISFGACALLFAHVCLCVSVALHEHRRKEA